VKALTLKNQVILNKIKRRLPHSTQGIISALGWEGALAFLRKHGGKGIVYFPKGYVKNHSFFEGLSETQALKLVEIIGGKEIRLPTHKTMLLSERYQLIAHDYEERNFTSKMLQQKYQLPERTINWVIKKHDLKS